MQVSTNDGGAREFLDGTHFYMAFAVMSNEISMPRVLVCPQDKDKTIATNFTTDFNASHLSYFLGVDATAQLTNSFFCGDRNLTNGTPVRNGIWEVTANEPAGWTGEIHQFLGNIVFADGSVRELSNLDLRKVIQKTEMKTNRLALP